MSNSVFLLPLNTNVKLLKTIDPDKLKRDEVGIIVKVFEELKAYTVAFSGGRTTVVMKEWVKAI